MIGDRSGKGSGVAVLLICVVVVGAAGYLVFQHREQVLGSGMVSEAQAKKDYEALPPEAQEILSKNYSQKIELPPGDRTKYRLANGDYQTCTLGRLVLDSLYYHQQQRRYPWLEGVVKDREGRMVVLFRERPILDRRRVAGGSPQTIVCLDVASMYGMGKTSYGSWYIDRAPDWSGMACKVAIDGSLEEVSKEETDLEDDSLVFTRICYPCKVKVINPRNSELKKGDVIDAYFWPDVYPPKERSQIASGIGVGAAYVNRDIRVDGKFLKGAWFLYETGSLE